MSKEKAGFRFLSDAPGREGQLWKGLESLAQRLAEILPELPRDSPILLSGAWGSGKTTLLKAVQRELETELLPKGEIWDEGRAPQRSIWFDAWKYEGEVALLPAMVRSVWAAYPSRDDEEDLAKAKDFFQKAWDFASKLALKHAPTALRASGLPFSVVIAGNLPAIQEAWEKLALDEVDLEQKFGIPDDPSEGLWQSFSDLLEQGWGEHTPVVFIDDLDRCSPEGAVALLDAIRVLVSRGGELPCRFVLAIDRQVMAGAISRKFEGIGRYDGNRYLEKVFPISFELPEPRRREAEKLVRQFLADDDKAHRLDPDDRDALTRALAEPIFANPRLMKRCINRFRLTLHFERQDTEPPLEEPLAAQDSQRNRSLAKWIAATGRWPALRTLLGQYGDPYWREAAAALAEGESLDHELEQLLSQRGARAWLRRELLPGKALRTDQFRDADRRLRRWGL